MDTKLALEYATFALIALCIGVPLIIWRKGLLREFPLPFALLLVQGLVAVIALSTLYFRKPLGLDKPTSFHLYFWGIWCGYVLEGILRIAIIYSVFHLAMLPMQGLHRIGKIVFRWVAGVSIVVAIAFAIGPKIAGTGTGAGAAATFTHIVSQGQQGVSVLTLCLLLFVCFATKPLGLTYRSRLFGVSVGLGILAATDLVQAACYSTASGHSLYSGVYLFSSLGVFSAFLVWGTYFAMPEPERKMITLPTTSPYFFWNRISEVLGDNPGEVVIAGFRPDMLSDAEIAMFSAPDKETAVPELAEERHMPRLQSAAY